MKERKLSKKITSQNITKEIATRYLEGTLTNDEWSIMTPSARKILLRYKKASKK